MKLELVNFEDSHFDEISTFFNNEHELYYSFPKTNFPLSKDDFFKTIENRIENKTVIYNNFIVGFANLFDVSNNNECQIGNVVINPKFRKKSIGFFFN